MYAVYYYTITVHDSHLKRTLLHVINESGLRIININKIQCMMPSGIRETALPIVIIGCTHVDV